MRRWLAVVPVETLTTQSNLLIRVQDGCGPVWTTTTFVALPTACMSLHDKIQKEKGEQAHPLFALLARN
jgi:hypothetical protein